MAIPVSCGPQQDEAPTADATQKKATRPANSDASRSEPVLEPPAEGRRGPPPPSRNGPAQEASTARRPATTTDRQTKKRPEPIQVAKNPPEPAPSLIARSPEYQATTAALSCKNTVRDGQAEESLVDSAKNFDASNPADLEPKNRLQVAASAAPCKNPTQDGKAEESRVEGAKNCTAPNAAAGSTDSGDLEPKNRIQAVAAAYSRSEQDEGQEEELAAAVVSDSGELEFWAPSGKEQTKDEEDTSVRTSGASSFWSFFPRPWLEPRRLEESEKEKDEGESARTLEAFWVWKFFPWPWLQQRLEGPDFLRKKTSLLIRLFGCCGLADLIVCGDLKVPDEDLKLRDEDVMVPHVTEKRILVSEAKSYYKIKKSLVEKLSKSYSSFRVVRGDGECFYRSFIYSYLEQLLENDDQTDEGRLLCACESVSTACQSVEWLYDDFCRSYMGFKELVEKVKCWKTETRAVRRMLLLSYFRDYRETEQIFTFLRTSSAGWLLTHPEISAFFAPEDDRTLEEHCQSEIIRSRSFADHLAIAALSDAFGIQIQIFSLPSGRIICTAPSDESNAVAVPLVSIVFTGIHYDILYPI